MARAKANSELRESLGKIQHKSIERERKDLKVGDASKPKTIATKPSTPGKGSAVVTSAQNRTSQAPEARSGGSSDAAAGKKTAVAAPEKKLKKAAMATTGYMGTARPRSNPSTTAKGGASGNSSLGDRPRSTSRYGGPLSAPRRRYEDDDDDLDDFIEYDEDEEDGYAHRYRYDSYDDESDMEAGLSDIEDEELAAERAARLEDEEQEALERRLKREKEERKRRLLEQAKAKSGSR